MSFTWGSSGRRMTPDQIAAQSKIAASLMRPDYSPIVSPWQGLARVAGNVTGALQQNRADKAQDANLVEQSNVVKALLASQATGGKPDLGAYGAAAVNPYLDDETRRLASTQLAALSKPAPVNDTEADFNYRAKILGPQAAKDWLARGNDPLINTTLPDGSFYSGPQSGLAARFASGGVPPQAPPQPPAMLPPDFDFGGGGPVAQAPATFPGPVQGARRGY